MREALEARLVAVKDAGPAEPVEPDVDLERRVETLEGEVGEVREAVEEMVDRLTQLERMAHARSAEAVDVENWTPPLREHDRPDAGVVTLEPEPDEMFRLWSCCGVGCRVARTEEGRR